ncbi:alpha/beta hydrolase [Hymenobacter psychrotolerans]|uniref:Predicted hydrolase of the alpha/beta superfamily n=1 Tax=Hymenobacter psychrotolerans DSM 18569 TaxID=1121959 RepID=A0A1M6VBV9_9BACT|nr:alpha/beta hydrolase-fold protein [Hymenobacter psychrotolerans]SHK78993.1 Predicted hydrolase of the alpha/beta superfamily [Hymenobacter psychrotolerans DSM 18569]
MKNLLAGALLLSPGFVLSQTVLHLTTIPANTPRTDTLYLAGSFNQWNPADAAYRLLRRPDGTYQFRFPAASPGTAEFKVTRGSWSRVETDLQNADIANRQVNLASRTATIELQVANWKDLAGGDKPCSSTALQPNVQVVGTAFEIPQLGRTRRVWVYLPMGYNPRNYARRYPVLYMHDGQNVFDACTSFAGEWGVDETLSQLQRQNPASACIVVAVDNGGENRLNELSPWQNAAYGGGQGEAYVDFLVHTLKPYIDARYHTLTAREFTGIAGSSMGGLISTYAALQHPLVYSKVGVFSPAFWFAEDSLRRYIQHLQPRPPSQQTAYYYVAGAQESETMVPLLHQLQAAVQRTDSLTTSSQVQVRPDGRHAEWFWRREFPAAFQWLAAQHTGSKGGRALRWAAWLEAGTRQLRFAADSAQNYRGRIEVRVYNREEKQVKRSTQAAGSTLDLSRLPAGEYRLLLQQKRRNGGQPPAQCQQLLSLPPTK